MSRFTPVVNTSASVINQTATPEKYLDLAA